MRHPARRTPRSRSPPCRRGGSGQAPCSSTSDCPLFIGGRPLEGVISAPAGSQTPKHRIPYGGGPSHIRVSWLADQRESPVLVDESRWNERIGGDHPTGHLRA